MKTYFLMVAFLAMGLMTMATGCDDNYIPENNYVQAFRQMYPEASRVEWEIKRGYEVAEFRYQNKEMEAWFGSNSEWVCTKWDIRRSDVPAVVMNALNASEYGSYKLDDVDMFHNPEGLFYVFEMEKGGRDYHCMFDEAGTPAEVPAIAH